MALEHITEAQIAAAGVASAPDILTGTPSEVKAIFDNLVRAVVATAVNLVVDEVNGHEADAENPHAVSKEQVGLGAADNTADADKPVSGPQAAALALKAYIADVLTKDNTTEFTPTENYHPATKKYVDGVTAGVILGQVPDNSITTAKLAAEVHDFINSKAAAVHASSHATGGSDPLTPAQIGADPAGSAAAVQRVFTPLLRFQAGLGNEYVWIKEHIEPEFDAPTSQTNQTVHDTALMGNSWLYYADSLDAFFAGNFTSIECSSANFANSSAVLAYMNANCKGKFISNCHSKITNTFGNVRYIPPTSSFYYSSAYGTFAMCTKLDSYGEVIGQIVRDGYINSTDSGAYPPSVSDGHTYTALGQLGKKLQMASGSYVGAGRSGPDYPNTLTFPFPPKILIIQSSGVSSNTSAPQFMVALRGLLSVPVLYSSSSYQLSQIFFTWDDLTVSWHSNTFGYDATQLNSSGKTYLYVAIGGEETA